MSWDNAEEGAAESERERERVLFNAGQAPVLGITKAAGYCRALHVALSC